MDSDCQLELQNETIISFMWLAASFKVICWIFASGPHHQRIYCIDCRFRTLRIWSLDDYKEITRCINKQRKVIKTKTAGGKRAIPTTCAYSADGKLVAAGCNDDSIHVWKHGHLYVRFYLFIFNYVSSEGMGGRCEERKLYRRLWKVN